MLKRYINKIRDFLGRKSVGFPFSEGAHFNRRLTTVEEKLEKLGQDPYALWLEANHRERMDAQLTTIFPAQRAEFHRARYDFACAYVGNRRFADIACGTGYGSDILIQQGKATLGVGIDIDQQAIYYARSRYLRHNLNFFCCSADNTLFPDASVDVVVSFETLEHVPDDRKLFAEYQRILAGDGLLIISTPNQWPLEKMPCHQRVYDYASLNNLLKDFFVVEKCYNQNSGSPWEYNHNQPPGIIETTDDNKDLAECFITICRKVNRQ